MKELSEGFWKTIGFCLAIIAASMIVLCIVQAIRMAGSDGMSYADMWHNWTAFFPKKAITEAVTTKLMI